ncbi:hypothetical protein D9M73_197310 [compost metagenome]
MIAQGECGADAFRQLLGYPVSRPDHDQRLVGDDIVSRESLQPQDDIGIRGQLQQFVEVDELKVAIAGRADRLRLPIERVEELAVGWPTRSSWRPPSDIAREQAIDALDQLLADSRHDLVGLDGNGYVMDEVDQHPHAHHREQHTERGRQVGDKGELIGAADGAQYQQAVEKGGDERAEHHLGGGIAHEVAQHARAELR